VSSENFAGDFSFSKLEGRRIKTENARTRKSYIVVIGKEEARALKHFGRFRHWFSSVVICSLVVGMSLNHRGLPTTEKASFTSTETANAHLSPRSNLRFVIRGGKVRLEEVMYFTLRH